MEGTRHSLEQAQDLLLSRARFISVAVPKPHSCFNWFFSGPAPGELGWEFLAQQAHQGNHAVSQNWGLAHGEDTAQCLACHGRGKQPAVCLAGARRGCSVPCRTEAGRAPPLQVAGGDEGVGPPHSAQVDHRTVVGHLH